MFDRINEVFSQFATDYVGVFTQDYTQVFKKARAIKAVVKEEAKVMEHPVESGAIITDHRVILPVEIDLSLILQSVDYAAVYRQIKSYYLQGTLLIIQTKSGVYENQLITSMPHEEDPEQYDALTVALSLKQVQFVTPQYGVNPKYPKHEDTVNRGIQQGSITPEPTTANQIFGGA